MTNTEGAVPELLPCRNLAAKLVMFLALSTVASGLANAAVAVETVKIADGIYQFITAPDGYVPNGNCVAVITQQDVLVYDTFTRPSTASVVLAEIRRLTNKPVRFIVNSHWHPDHWSGNEVFAQAFPGLEIIASEETRQFMLNIANAWPPLYAARLRKDQADLEKEATSGLLPDGNPLTPEQRRSDEEDLKLEQEYVAEAATVHRTYPTLTYSQALTLYHGGREFRFLEMVGDARGDTVLYLPKEKILVTGDLLSSPVPYYTPPLSEHAQSLRRLSQFDADIIIPGHGPARHDKSYLELELNLLDSIIAQVRQAVQLGLVTIEEVQKAVNVDPLRAQFTHDDAKLNARFHRYVNGMIENAYREARDGKKFEY